MRYKISVMFSKRLKLGEYQILIIDTHEIVDLNSAIVFKLWNNKEKYAYKMVSMYSAEEKYSKNKDSTIYRIHDT